MNDLVPTVCSPRLDQSPLNAGTSEVSQGVLVAIARRLVFARLRRITHGTMTVIEGERNTAFGDPASPSALRPTITIRDSGCYLDISMERDGRSGGELCPWCLAMR